MLGRDEQRPAVPPGEGSAGLRSGAVPRQDQFDQHGRRVVEGQRLMQSASDIMLGWLHIETSTAKSATSTSASCGTPRARRHRVDGAAGAGALRQDLRLDARESPRPLGRHDRDRRYLGKGDVFDRAMAEFAERTPTRTSGTTARSRRQPRPAASPPSWESDRPCPGRGTRRAAAAPSSAVRELEVDEHRSEHHGDDPGRVRPLVALEEGGLRAGDDLVLDRRRVARGGVGRARERLGQLGLRAAGDILARGRDRASRRSPHSRR